MNEKLQQSLVAIIDQTSSGMDAGVSFLLAEVPDVIEQLLMWKMLALSVAAISSGVAMVVILCVMLSIAYGVRHKRGVWHKESGLYGLSDFGLFVGGFCFVATAPASNIFFSSSGDLIQIWLAPKIYLIEYAASLAK